MTFRTTIYRRRARLAVAAATAWATLTLAGVSSAQTPPVVATDHPEYLVGSTVTITGAGFAPGEEVTVQVRRTSLFFEQGRQAFAPVQTLADAAGRVTTTWTLGEGLGVNFLVWAAGATSGPAQEPASFHRVAQLRTDKRQYRPGEIAQVTGVGFGPGRSVTVTMEAAQPLAPGPVTADAQGRIAATFLVNADALAHRVEAFSIVDDSSWLSAMAGFAEDGVTVVDDGGVGDVPRTWYHWREDDLLYFRSAFRRDLATRALDVTIGWNATWMASYETPTIFLDTNGNGRIDVAVANEVEGDPIDNRRTAFPYSCDDSSAITCGQWNYLPGSVGQAWFKAAQGTLAQNLLIPLPAIGLAPNAEEPVIVNVCGGGSGDCVVTPGSGFLTLEVTVPAGHATAAFPLALATGASTSGASSWTITPRLLRTGAAGAVSRIPMAPGTYQLDAAVPAGWTLVDAGCRPAGPVAPAEPLPVAGPASASLPDVVVLPGMITTCKLVATPAVQTTSF